MKNKSIPILRDDGTKCSVCPKPYDLKYLHIMTSCVQTLSSIHKKLLIFPIHYLIPNCIVSI